jgi:hypothetical protein
MSRGGNTVSQHIEIRRYMHGRRGLATLGMEQASEEARSHVKVNKQTRRLYRIIFAQSAF